MTPQPAAIIVFATIAAAVGIAATLVSTKLRKLSKPSNKEIGLSAALGVVVAWFATPAAMLVSPFVSSNIPHRLNSLAINQHAKVNGPVQLKIQPPTDLNFKKRAEVMQARTDAVQQHPELLLSEYQPSWAVFGMIEDGRPWWGTKGMAVYGPGKRSINGPSAHSCFIMNPFMLVGIRPAFGLRSTNRMLFIPEERIDSVRLFCYPIKHEWFPKEGRSHVVFDMTSYINDVQSTMTANSSTYVVPAPYKFDVAAYNARDMGLEYISVPPAEMKNVVPTYTGKTTAFINPQFFHCGGSCGYPGGCNNQSPACPPLDDFKCTSLPAKFQVRLYRDPPTVLDRADFVCDVDII
jgi:hypothetical protein